MSEQEFVTLAGCDDGIVRVVDEHDVSASGSNESVCCPLCGNDSEVTRLGSVFNISCGIRDDDSDTCGLVLFGGKNESKQQIINKWNRRT